MGLVGGGEGAFIGAVHRMAAALDGQVELVCAALSSDAERARRSGQALYLPPARSYADYRTMMQAERALPAAERMDFVAIVTPNHLHLPVALAAIEHGFHVLSDKPATLNLEECRSLRAALQAGGVLYGLTHAYAGYPLVREAQARIAAGELGAIRKVVVDYAQGWLSAAEESAAPGRGANKQAEWRVDPQRAGAGGCIGDIGVHAAHLAEYVTGLKISALCADLTAFVPGRRLDDDSSMLLRFDGGARGILHASQICCGEENNLTLRVYGERGGLVWSQEEPNSLWLLQADRPRQLLRAGSAQLTPEARALARVPPGHPEGYLEAFANIYGDFVAALRSVIAGTPVNEAMARMPGIDAGIRGMAFIEAAVASNAAAQQWVALADA
jgi:predicted dehydrogenase